MTGFSAFLSRFLKPRGAAASSRAASPTVAVIGGGFSGALVVANLVREAKGPLKIHWFESGPVLGLGVAYSTNDPSHLLNVRAVRMGAFAGEEDGFYKWLQTAEGRECTGTIWPGRHIGPDTYVPRMLFARYLESIVERAHKDAAARRVDIVAHKTHVTDVAPEDLAAQFLRISFEKDGRATDISVSTVVLASGNLPPRVHAFRASLIKKPETFVYDVWRASGDANFSKMIRALSADDEVVIIGTGLTMVDTMLSLKSRGYKGTITAISRNGLLHQPHVTGAKPYPAWDWVSDPARAPRTARGLFQGLRREIKKAQGQGYAWQSVVDSLRPITQTLWKGLSLQEKRKFLSRLFTIWNIHRHRMAPEIHENLRDMIQSGTLKVVAAKIYYVGSDADGLTVAYRRRGANRVETLRPALVLNCAGSDFDLAAGGRSLLKNMRDRELITVGPLRAGIDLFEDGSARGRAPGVIFPIGMLNVGELLETTAVPELREQAQETARRVLRRLGL